MVAGRAVTLWCISERKARHTFAKRLTRPFVGVLFREDCWGFAGFQDAQEGGFVKDRDA